MLRRTKAWGYDPDNMRAKMFAFQAPATIEGIHPLEGGIFRRKYRRDRRPGMPVREPVRVLPALRGEIVVEDRALRRAVLAVPAHPRARPPHAADPTSTSRCSRCEDGDLDALELFTATAGARVAAEKQRRRKRALAAADT